MVTDIPENAEPWTAKRCGAPVLDNDILNKPVTDPMEIVRKQGSGVFLRRGAAMWIDFGVSYVVATLPALFVLIAKGPQAAETDVFGQPWFETGMLVWAVVAVFAYFILLEGLAGRTAGKLLLGIKVVNTAGKPPGVGMAALRTLLRLIETNPVLLGGLPALAVAASSKSQRRLGDMAAKTYVVRSNQLKRDAAAAE